MPSFAYDTTENLIDSQDMRDWEAMAYGTYNITYSSGLNTIILPRSTGSTSSYFTYYFYEIEGLRMRDEYEFSFTYMSNNLYTYDISACLFVLTAGGSIVQPVSVITTISSPTYNSTYQTYNCRFIPEQLVTVSSGYRLAIGFYFNGANSSSTSSSNDRCYIKDISLVNLDSNEGFFNAITNALGYLHLMLEEKFNSLSSWLTNVKDGIVNKLGTVQTAITNAIDNIQTWLNTVKTAITDKLEAVKTGIQNTLNTVKTAITDKLENVKIAIGDFFTMLKNYLLYFKHPVTLNNEGVPVDSQGNPVYMNPFKEPDIFETLDEWVENIQNSKETTEEAAEEGLEHISGVMGIITTLFTRVPFLTIFFGFILAVVIIKKVTGR